MSRFFRQAGDSDSDTEDSEEELLSSGDDAPSRPSTSASKPTGMSRFLKGNSDSDSDSDSDSEDEDGSESDDQEQDEETGKKKSRFLVGDSGDEGSDEDVKRVVKSAKDKRLDEMEATGKNMENALKINDWVAISNEFDKLIRLVQRQTNVAERVPAFYIKTLASLENSLNDALAKEKEAKKKMNASNARALTAMKQKVKKTTKQFEVELKFYQKDPETFEQTYAAVEQEVVAAPVKKEKRSVLKEAVVGSEDEDFTTVGKGGKAMQFTSEGIYKNLQLIQEARGKKNTDRAEQISILERLLEVAATTYQRIRVLLALVSARFDYNTSISSHMPTELWLSAQREVDELIQILTADSRYVVEEITADYPDDVERTPEQEPNGVVQVRGSIIGFVDRLDDEFTKSLQNTDPHGTEYIDRLRHETGLYRTICYAQAYYEKTKQRDALGRVVLRRLEHVYSKPDPVLQALETAAGPGTTSMSANSSSNSLIRALCVHLYKSDNPVLRTRAMLCHIYHHALHNDFHTARDMFLMSHLQESIHAADVATQILYNRAVVQVGLCAFRVGLIKEAQSTLQDIFATQRVKELLAQGGHQQRYQTMTAEQEKAERQRQLPFHMHVNTELLEAAFLVSSMLIEIPLLASIESEELKRKTVSKPFRRLLDFADRQVLTGPPESTRDHIMQASKALQEGDWQRCRDLISSINVWNLMPEVAEVKTMLSQRIQEEGLRTYLFTYAPHYSTLSLKLLSETFALPLRTVTLIVSRMIWNDELAASLDSSSGVVVLHRAESNRVQQLAQVLADRVNAMVEQNEKTLDQKLGSSATWGDRAEGMKGEKRGETTERKGRDRTRGGATRGGRGGRGGRFSQGLGMPSLAST